MKWQEKWAVLKLAGYKLSQDSRWISEPERYFRYHCENGWLSCPGDTKAKAVNDTWVQYVRVLNSEMARQIGGAEAGGV